MNIVAVDDERPALEALKQAIHAAVPAARVAGFLRPQQALAHARANRVQLAFLDVEMKEMTGLQLAKALKDINGATGIIFATAHPQYAVDAFTLPAGGYLLKPIREESVKQEIEKLNTSVVYGGAQGVFIQTFGSFEVFANGAPLAFRRSRAREVLAYLVDRRGAAVTKKELAGVLWGDAEYTRSNQVYLQMLVAELLRALQAAGAGHIIHRGKGSLALDTRQVRCDYYDFLAGDAAAVNAYHGEYMANYSWAEWTQGALEEKQKKAWQENK